ncbi:ATP-binding protein [Thermomonospora umbrina]|uniref:Anti-sigma regulatory factor (Ser/Thr protein kinase) n=1 Tax=Thermomonospora umbrina TaxID=111806 RepID=A0A3D9SQS0_9ACTN|nr:ATP-binding protein [Thermomonospora umbrina]REE96323.1 anti-sigma regulatory factor (Ser/Thr protein kinase) [Thermomonospora umbrina]
MTVAEMLVTHTPGVVRMHGREYPVGDMCWRRSFAGLPMEARRARDFARFLLEGFSRADDAVQAAAELVANALQHTRSGGPGGLFVMEVRRWRGGAALTVIDQGGPRDPAPRSVERSEGVGGTVFDLPESGRGLLAVSATASWWDWCGGPGGRTVTAVFYSLPI